VSGVPRSFRPRGAGTGVGSMPQPEAAEAVEAAVTACPELPFWPTRPLAVPAEEMIRQWAAGLPGVGEARGGVGEAQAGQGEAVEAGQGEGEAGEGPSRPAWVGRDRAPGGPGLAAAAAGSLDPFLRALSGRPEGWLKLQATGPVTLALAVEAGDRRAFSRPEVRGPLALGYAARIRGLVTKVREALPGWKLLLVLDEPSLGDPMVAERPRIAVELWRAVGATGAELTGLHCCAPPPWPLILDIDPQLVSFDAVSHGDDATDDPAFRRLVESGSAVAWGLVPATGPLEDAHPDDLADRLLDLVEWTAGDYLPEVLARSLVTPTCGLASTEPGEAVRRLSLAATVGSRAWEFAELP
jgi:hypothetical protein